MSETIVSYNRPLTRNAEKDLKEYGILSQDSVNEWGCWTVVELETKPSKEVLEKHELRLEQEPSRVYLTENGERVEVYDSRVMVDGMEQSTDPEKAVQYASERGWVEQ